MTTRLVYLAMIDVRRCTLASGCVPLLIRRSGCPSPTFSCLILPLVSLRTSLLLSTCLINFDSALPYLTPLASPTRTFRSAERFETAGVCPMTVHRRPFAPGCSSCSDTARTAAVSRSTHMRETPDPIPSSDSRAALASLTRSVFRVAALPARNRSPLGFP